MNEILIELQRQIAELRRDINRLERLMPAKVYTPAWEDINLGAALLSLPAASNPGIDEFVDNTGTDTGIETRAFAIGESVSGAYEIKHSYKQGGTLKPHVHFQIIAAPTGTDYVRFQLIYTIARDGTTLAPVTTIAAEVAVDTQYESYRLDLPDIDGTDVLIGDQFLFGLSRIATIGAPFAGEALIQTTGTHIQQDGLGSRSVGVK